MEPHDTPARCWVAFGYQNHLVPAARSGEIAGSCGVLADPVDLEPRDGRPTCSVCATTARTGEHAIVPFSGTID
ncbi:hypothetical protein ABZ805_04065 [Saccharopolyspora sp. NPDC047091]|uniref:hypothetical protein n=1 Tax=Saccharopolyspora sp. NPDC047091 TaxID=3155924 RepID=UPI0033DA3F41